MYGTYHTRTVIPYAYGIQNCTIRVWYGTHQLQLKRNTRVTRKSHTCYTRVFLPAYTQLHAIEFIFVYRLTRVTITCLHAKPPGPLSVTKTGPPDHFTRTDFCVTAHAYTSIETRGLNDIGTATYNTLSRNSCDNTIFEHHSVQRGRFEEVYHDHADLLKKTGNTETGKKNWLRISNTKAQTA